MTILRGGRKVRFLLIGPYDPHCGEYTFLAPPLGVWRLAGYLDAKGVEAVVFDPNCCSDPVLTELADLLAHGPWDLIGVSTTAMTLRFDLQLLHFARKLVPAAIYVAGGMEATFNPERVFSLAPFDLIVLGEGEKPLAQIATRLAAGADIAGIAGTALRSNDGQVVRFPQKALDSRELAEAIAWTPYERMPYDAYWQRLEAAYKVGKLPFKADREARLAEIRSVRLITLNYCPMACSFCSSTNFLHEAQGSVARVARLSTDDCIAMIKRIVAAHPTLRTVIFQDDIFVFTQDSRLLPLCAEIVRLKRSGDLPANLEFISTNRIDSMTTERLAAMRAAGFRVLGFGVENFSARVLGEFNKAQIHRHIEPMLAAARAVGITPFLDLILTSPQSTLSDFAENIRQAFRWIGEGCEVGIYPYVIPFSGATLARDPSLAAYTTYETLTVPGTAVSWRQASKILPTNVELRRIILLVESRYEQALEMLHSHVSHLPSRVRSLLWIACAETILRGSSELMPRKEAVIAELAARLPLTSSPVGEWLDDILTIPVRELSARALA